MSLEQVRHYSRYAVNVVALLVAIFALPEFGAAVPESWLAPLAVVAATLNTVLSWLRRIA